MQVSCATGWARALGDPSHSVGAADCILEQIRSAGFGAVEFDAHFAPEAKALEELLQRFGLQVTGVTLDLNGDAGDLASLEQFVRVARGIGAMAVSIRSGSRRAHSIEWWAEFLERSLVRADAVELRLVNASASRFEQPGDFRELFVRLTEARLRVVVDVLEYHRAGVDPRQAVDELADRASCAILADAIGNRQVPLGDGEVNVRSVLAHARRAGGVGWIVLNPAVSSWETAAEDLAGERLRLEAMLKGAYTVG